MKFYMQGVIVHRCCYTGHGMDPMESDSVITLSGLLPRGWLADFIFYARNNHPFGMLLCKSQAHPFSTKLVVLDFVATFTWSFMTAAFMTFLFEPLPYGYYKNYSLRYQRNLI